MFFVPADAITMLDPNDMDLCSIVWASSAYVVANLDSQLPREGEYPSKEVSGAPTSHITSAASLVMLLHAVWYNL